MIVLTSRRGDMDLTATHPLRLNGATVGASMPGVMTQREYEQLIRVGEAGDSQHDPRSVVMIQCVGSRDEKHPYCSRICCSEAIKNALETKRRSPECQVTVLYRDIRAFGFKEDLYREARLKGVVFLEYDPDDKPVVENDNGRLSVRVNVQPEGESVAQPRGWIRIRFADADRGSQPAEPVAQPLRLLSSKGSRVGRRRVAGSRPASRRRAPRAPQATRARARAQPGRAR